MMLLIAMAITVAYVASLATTFGAFDLEFWWELAALITIMLLGHWQEMKALGQAQSALSALAALLPDEAELVGADGSVATVPVDRPSRRRRRARPTRGSCPGRRRDRRRRGRARRVDDHRRIATGREGTPTTRSSRAPCRPTRPSVCASTRSARQTALAGIRRLVDEAQASHSRAQALADRFAALLFYVATGTALLTFTVWALLGDIDNAVVRTVTVLVIACPHALGLAIPLVVSISSAVAARNGILVKDRFALERMRTIDAVLFDKTGTLTKGEHAVPASPEQASTRTRCSVSRQASKPTASIPSPAPSSPRPSASGDDRARLGLPFDDRSWRRSRRSTESGTPSAVRPCCESARSRSRSICDRGSTTGPRRGAAVLYLVEGRQGRSARSRSRTRSDRKRSRPSTSLQRLGRRRRA